MKRLALAASVAAIALPVVLPPPAGLSPQAWQTLGVMVLMALWWLAEIVPLAATALVPLAVFPLIGAAPMPQVSASYGHPVIVLFLGGFLLAQAIEKWQLHHRVSRRILAVTGRSPAGTVAGLMLATAFLSLWISNTAAAMVMAPVGAAVAASRPGDDGFAAATLLGIAYSATIGGMGSIIGTPPNALFAAYMESTHGVVIGFAEWAAVGLPAVAILLPLAWFVLTRVAFRLGDAPLTLAQADPAPLPVAGRRVAWIALATALAWIFRPVIDSLLPESGVSDAGIAMVAALALFLAPDGAGGRLLDWRDAAKLRWDVLILFGGGLALAGAIEANGLAAWIADTVASFDALPVVVFAAILAVTVVLVGELASNTAVAAIFLPIAGASAVGLGAAPLDVALPVALAASMGFMLPVATPPNAIVFAYDAVNRKRMLRAGIPLDMIGVTVAVGLAFVAGPLVFGG